MCEVLDTAVRKAVSRERQKFNTAKNREIAAIVREKDRVITEKDRVITEKDRVITEKDQVIAETNLVIADMDRSLKFKNQQIESLRSENELLRKRIASAIVKNSSITPPDSKNQMGLVKEKQFSYISPID